MMQFYPNTPARYLQRRSIRKAGNLIGLSCLLGLIVAYLVVIAVQVVAILLGASDDFFTSVPYEMLTQIFYTFLTSVLPFILCARLLGFRVGDLIPLKPTRPGLTVALVMMAMSMSIAGSYVSSMLDGLLSLFDTTAKMPEFPQPTDPIGFILSILVIAVAPALMEEFAFRGIILGSLRRFGDGFAIVMSALLFGMFHGNLVQIPSAFVMGLALGYITVLSGSMWPAVIAHFVNNLLATVLPYVYEWLPEPLVTPVDLLITLLLVGGGLLGFVILAVKHPGGLRLPKPAIGTGVMTRVGWFLTAPAILLTLLRDILLIILVQVSY